MPAGLVLFVALVARLWRIDLARFADDQATLLGSAAHFVATRELPLTTGMSFTIGVRHPPLATFLLVPPELLSRSPVLASAYVAVLDAFGAFFVFQAGRRLAGRWAGAAAGLLFALEPAAVIYGRTVWNPDLVVLCAAIAVWGMVEAWQHNNDWALAAALFAIGCGAQLHPQAAALLVVWLAVAFARGRWRWQSAAAVGALAVVLSPYLYLQATSGWSDLRAAAQYLQQPKHLDVQAFDVVTALFSARTYTELLLPHGDVMPAFAMDPLGWFFAACLAAGLTLAFVRRRPNEVLAAACFVAPLLASLSHSGSLAPHYLLVLLPPGCVLAGLALAALRPRWVGSAFLGLGLAWAGLYGVQLQRSLPEAVDANYDMPLGYSRQAADLVAAPAGDVYISDRDEHAGVFGYLLNGRPNKRFDGRYTFVYPRGPATYVADAGLEFAYSELSRLSEPARAITTPGGRPAYGLFRLNAAEPPRLQPLDVDVGHALRLVGYQARDLRAGGLSTVLIEWQVTDAHGPIPDDLRQYGHLVDADGRIWSDNPDFRGYPRSQWQTGDAVLAGFVLNLPSNVATGGYWFETGFYEPISAQRLPQYREGQPAGSSARIGPLKVRGQSPPVPAAQPAAVFGNGQIALVGVQRSASSIVVRWRALRKPAADYTVFVHVLDANGVVAAQDDSQPRSGSYPTSLWDPGEVVEDAHALSFTPEPGQQLELGLYTLPDLRRLPVDATGADHVLLPLPTS